MDNWDIFIFGAGMVGLVIWALYFTSTVVDELRELNRQAGIIARGVENSRQELEEIKQLLQQLILDR